MEEIAVGIACVAVAAALVVFSLRVVNQTANLSTGLAMVGLACWVTAVPLLLATPHGLSPWLAVTAILLGLTAPVLLSAVDLHEERIVERIRTSAGGPVGHHRWRGWQAALVSFILTSVLMVPALLATASWYDSIKLQMATSSVRQWAEMATELRLAEGLALVVCLGYPLAITVGCGVIWLVQAGRFRRAEQRYRRILNEWLNGLDSKRLSTLGWREENSRLARRLGLSPYVGL